MSVLKGVASVGNVSNVRRGR